MSHDKRTSNPLFIRFISALIGVAGLWLLGAWLLSAPTLNASDAQPAPLTFQSPIGNPQLDIAKTVDNDTPMPDDVIEYTLTYSTTNPGSQAFNVRLYDFLPAGVQFISANPTADAYQDGMLLFTASSLDSAKATATVRVRVQEGYEQLYNHALLMADYLDPTHTSLLMSVEQPPKWLRLTKTGHVYGYEVVLVNGELAYQLTCENTSNVTVDDVTVVDVLPTGLALVETSPPPDFQTLPTLVWSLGELAKGEHRTIVVTATAPAVTGTITNTALADARQRVVTQTMFATQVVTDAAILQIAKMASAPVIDVGDELVYTLLYRNIGNRTATGVMLTDTLPADVSVTGVYPPATSQTPQYVIWDLDPLGQDESGKAVITVTVGGGRDRTLHNAADITGLDSFPGHAELDTQVRPAMLYLPIVMRAFHRYQ